MYHIVIFIVFLAGRAFIWRCNGCGRLSAATIREWRWENHRRLGAECRHPFGHFTSEGMSKLFYYTKRLMSAGYFLLFPRVWLFWGKCAVFLTCACGSLTSLAKKRRSIWWFSGSHDVNETVVAHNIRIIHTYELFIIHRALEEYYWCREKGLVQMDVVHALA